jgi:hypothetical protein
MKAVSHRFGMGRYLTMALPVLGLIVLLAFVVNPD